MATRTLSLVVIAVLVIVIANPALAQVTKLSGSDWKQSLTGEWMIKL